MQLRDLLRFKVWFLLFAMWSGSKVAGVDGIEEMLGDSCLFRRTGCRVLNSRRRVGEKCHFSFAKNIFNSYV